MRKIFIKILQGLGFVFIFIILYYTFIVIKARIETEEIVSRYSTPDIIKLKSDDLTQRQLDILLKVQDPNFYNHKGVDLKTPGAGLTTISQAVVKKLYFKSFKPGVRKIKQTLIARFAFNSLISKKKQLDLFINLMWFGPDIVGFADASQHYYKKKFKRLSENEYISLVAMIIAPRTFNLKDHPESNRERVRRIKLLIAGKYRPKGLMDQYYGPLDEYEKDNVAPFSYFED